MTSQPPLKLAIFDCDGTIVDSRAMIVEGMRRSFAEQQLAIPGDRAVMDLVGLPLRDVLQMLAGDIEIEPLDRLTESYRQHFITLHNDAEWKPPLYPGTEKMLEQLVEQHRCLLGIATGKSRRGLDRTLADEAFSVTFATTWTADDGPAKPNPTILEAAMDEVGAYPEQCIMVGDTTFDIDMGNNAGIKTIAVPWGNHTLEQLRASNPDVIIESWDDLVAWCGEHFASAS